MSTLSSVPEEHRIKFKSRPNKNNIVGNNEPKITLINHNQESINDGKQLKLNLTRKDKNSPYLSIQTFIYEHLMDHKSVNIKRLWEKYEKQEAHSLLIKRHRLNYEIFREIAEQILETLEPYQLVITPVSFPVPPIEPKLITKTL